MDYRLGFLEKGREEVEGEGEGDGAKACYSCFCIPHYSPMSVKYTPRNKTSYTKPTRDLTREIKTERTKRNAVVFTHTA